jgi:hypothetical protein
VAEGGASAEGRSALVRWLTGVLLGQAAASAHLRLLPEKSRSLSLMLKYDGNLRDRNGSFLRNPRQEAVVLKTSLDHGYLWHGSG